MKLGCQSGPTTDQRLQFFARHSLKHIDGVPEESKERGYATVEELTRLKERAAKWGISVEMITPSFLASTHVDRTERPAIVLGESPERDRDIERFQMLMVRIFSRMTRRLGRDTRSGDGKGSLGRFSPLVRVQQDEQPGV